MTIIFIIVYSVLIDKFINWNIDSININEEDVIRTSQQFGGSIPGLEDDDNLLG